MDKVLGLFSIFANLKYGDLFMRKCEMLYHYIFN